MADDKGAGGGGKWEPFEIVLIILLAIGLLTQLNGKKATPPTSTPKGATITKTTTPNEACGLTTSRPHALEKITSFVTLSGTVTGCDWTPTDTVALYAQVIDARGMPMSAYTTVAAYPLGWNTASFTTTIALTGTPAKGNGYIILIPATPSGTASTTARIPIIFTAQ